MAEEAFLKDGDVNKDLVRIVEGKAEEGKKDRGKGGYRGVVRRKAKEVAKEVVLAAMLYADDAGIVSRTAGSLAKMMTVIVTKCEEFGLTVSEKKTATMCMRAPKQPAQPMDITAAGQRYAQTRDFVRSIPRNLHQRGG